MREKITDRLINALKPTDKEYEVWDHDLPGFCLIVRPNGRVTFCYRYRAIDGKNKKITLGRYGELTTFQARKLATARAGEVASGVDVQAVKKQAKAEASRLASRQTVSTLFDQFASVELIRRADSGKEARRTFTKHALSVIGSLPVDQVGRGHIGSVLDPIVARSNNRTAKDIAALLRQMWRFALDRDLVQHDPTSTFTKAKVGGRDSERTRVLSDKEIRELARKISNSNLRPQYKIAIWLQLATCCRVGELLAAKWDQVDLDTAEWHIPDPKNENPHIVHLSPFALGYFQKLKIITGAETWCFPTRTRKGALKSTGPVGRATVAKHVDDRQLAENDTPLNKRTPETDALVLPGGKWTPHDLRRTGATLMTMLGVLPEVAERCLNHKEQNRVKRIYQRYSYAAEMREAWRLLGEHLERLTGLESVS